MADNKVIIVQESVVSSLIKDVATFVMFAGLMWFNHEYLNGNVLIDLSFILLIVLFLMSRSSSSVFKGTKKDAIKWLKEN